MSAPWWAAPEDPRRGNGRTWTTRGLLTGVLAAAVILASAAVGATSPHTAEVTKTPYGHDVRPSVRALADGCGVTQFVVDPPSKIGTVDFTGELAYWPQVPVSGWFSNVRAEPGDLKASPEKVLNAMWFGDRVVWVAADAPATTTSALIAIVAAHPQWRAVVRPWPAGRNIQLDPGTYAAASWGVTQTCAVPDALVIGAMFAAAPVSPGQRGDALPSAFGSSADGGQVAQEG